MLFAPGRLALVDGVHSRKIYIAILGHMFDVTRGAQHYGEPLLTGGRARSDLIFRPSSLRLLVSTSFSAAAVTQGHSASRSPTPLERYSPLGS